MIPFTFACPIKILYALRLHLYRSQLRERSEMPLVQHAPEQRVPALHAKGRLGAFAIEQDHAVGAFQFTLLTRWS